VEIGLFGMMFRLVQPQMKGSLANQDNGVNTQERDRIYRRLQRLLCGAELSKAKVANGTKVPGRLEPIRSFADGPSAMMAEYPVLIVKRSYARSTVECPLTVAAVVWEVLPE